MQKSKIRKSEGCNWAKATHDEQPYEAAEAFYIIVGIAFPCCYQQFYEIADEPREPAYKVKDEDQSCCSRIISCSWIVVHLTLSFPADIAAWIYFYNESIEDI